MIKVSNVTLNATNDGALLAYPLKHLKMRITHHSGQRVTTIKPRLCLHIGTVHGVEMREAFLQESLIEKGMQVVQPANDIHRQLVALLHRAGLQLHNVFLIHPKNGDDQAGMRYAEELAHGFN